MHTTAHLTQPLLRLGILTAEQAEGLAKIDAQQFSDARSLATELIRRGWLTPYQANQLLLGRGDDLVLSSYVLLERLGEGAMGQVFKARHCAMARIVALKLLRKERVANPEAVHRFQREIRAAARLVHPNFVLVYDADVSNGNHFFVMEYVEGSDLQRFVKAGGPLAIGTACDLVRQVAEGLGYAHSRGFVHRDVKPGNLLRCGGDGTPPVIKILDMGLARLEELSEEPTLTQDGKILGTPDYIAPEQAVNSRGVDARADLYSLGCTLYFLLTSRVPFPGGGSIMERLMRRQTAEPVPIEQVRADVPEPVRAVLRRLIARRPEDRFQSAAELAKELASIAPDVAKLEGTPAPPAQSAAPLPRWLGDVAAAEQARAGPLDADSLPDWIDDIRRKEGG